MTTSNRGNVTYVAALFSVEYKIREGAEAADLNLLKGKWCQSEMMRPLHEKEVQQKDFINPSIYPTEGSSQDSQKKGKKSTSSSQN